MMIRKLAVGALVASALSVSTGVRAGEHLPGVDLANSIVNDLTAPLRPLLVADATPAAAPAAAPAAKAKHHAGKHHARPHHAKAHKTKAHVASRKIRHKAG